MSRVLIAGCGDVGTALGLRLVAQGHRVWGLRRDASRLPAAIAGLAGDLARPSDLRDLPGDLDLVFYTTAATQHDDDGYRAAYVDGLRNLLEALDGTGPPPRRVIFTSSTSVYGQDDGSWVDESSATDPTGFSGQRMVEAEQLLAASPYPHTSVRFGGIYGPGRTRLLESVRSGKARCGDTPSYTNRIHRDDCADLLAHLATLPDPAPVYIGVDDAPVARCEVLHWLAERLEVASPHDAGEAGPARGKRCSNDLIRASGYHLTYPSFQDGYAPLIEG